MEPSLTIMNEAQEKPRGTTLRKAAAIALITVALAGLSYVVIRTYTDPLNVATRQEARVLRQINETKRTIESLEGELQAAQAELAQHQTERAEIEKRKIEAANRGVKDTRPIKVDTAAAFPSAGT
jgi:septal ring factor EnvC (AmiA/AmiB activator)